MTLGLGTKRAGASALVRVQNVSKRFVQRAPFSRRKFFIDALRSVDLEIHPNCLTAIVGESGSGKSTLAACIASLQKPDSGRIWFDGEDISNAGIVLHKKVQLVFQDAAGALNPRFNAVEIIEEPLDIQKLGSKSQRKQTVRELMEQVGLPAECAARRASQLSGGQRQRLAIARALALRPRLLILDESLSGLDLITQAEILNLLAQLRSSHALTYLLISHDIGLVSLVSDYIAVMHKGSLVEQGPQVQVFSAPQHEHTRRLISSVRASEARFHEIRSRSGHEIR